MTGPSEAAQRVIDALARGLPGPFSQFRHNGTEFRNDDALLPVQNEGYYTEWSVPGQERVVSGRNGELFYSGDHYTSFMRIR